MTRKTMFLICLGLVGLWIASQLFKNTITVEDSQITIDKIGHHIEGRLAPEERHEFVLMKVEPKIKVFSGDGFFTVLPLSEAQILKLKFGQDFLQDDSPGAVETKNSSQPAILLAKDATVKTTLAKAVELLKQGNNPVLAFTGSRIEVTRHTFLRMAVNDDSNTRLYYLPMCEISSQEYQ